MMFKPLRQNCFTAFAHLFSGECKAIVVENPTDKEVIVTQNPKLKNIMDSDAQIMTAVKDIDIYHLAETPASTPCSERRLLTKGLLSAATGTSLRTANSVEGNVKDSNKSDVVFESTSRYKV